MNNTYSKFKSIWIEFDKYDERMNYPQIKDDYNEIYESTWHKKISIHENYFWNITCNDVMNDEELKRERESVWRNWTCSHEIENEKKENYFYKRLYWLGKRAYIPIAET